jgi:archaellum component FlaC
MMIQLELWQLLISGAGLLLTFLGGVWGIAVFILAQMEKRLDERFAGQEKSREEEKEIRAAQLSGIESQLERQEQAREAGKKHWDDQFYEIDKQLANHRERIGRLEKASEVGPTHKDLSDLHERMNGIAEDLSLLSGEFKGVSHLLKTIHNFLMTGGKP